MKTYRVEWAIDIDAETPEQAARKARTIQQDPKSIATVFTVTEFDRDDGEFEQIDLDAIDEAKEEDTLTEAEAAADDRKDREGDFMNDGRRS